jgi:transposase
MKRTMGRGIKSWELTDEVWEGVQEFLRQRKQDRNQDLPAKAGGGTETPVPRLVLGGILYVWRTGIQWKALPEEYGAASSVHQEFSEWAVAGFFRRMWPEELIA